MGHPPFPFIPLREPTSAPAGHLLPEEGGRSAKAFPVSSFRAKSRNLPCTEARRIGHLRQERERGNTSQGRKLRVSPSPYRHFERSEKSSLHTGETESVRQASERLSDQPHACRTPLRQERSLGCARDDETRDGLSHVSSYPAARANLRPFGAPPSRGRREKCKSLPRIVISSEARNLPCTEGADRALAQESERGKRLKQAISESTAFPASSFRAKREIFFAHRKTESVR